MARRAALAALLVGLLGTLRTAQGEDLQLSDALDDVRPSPTAKPKPKPPSADDDFKLEDAFGDGDHNDPVLPGPPKPKPSPKPNPRPNQPGTSGGFSDSDLLDGNAVGGGGGGGDRDGGGGGDTRHDGEGQGEPQGVVPGIVAAVVMAVAGAISSFIAYQKKKLCFKENTDQGDINMESHRNANMEPPVQRTLLEK